MPTTRAQGYAIMKMCEEFSMAGADIELIVPNRRSNEETSDPFKYYGIKNKFPIKKLWSFDLLGPYEAFGKLFYWIDMLSFLFSVKINTRKFDGVFYTRDYLVALVLPKNNNICLEVHDIPKSKFIFSRILKKIKHYIVLNNYIKNELIALGVKGSEIITSPSGVDLSFFDLPVSKLEAREKISLPLDKKIITYTGHFYGWKGVDTLAEVAKKMPDNIFLFIGGVEPDLSRFRSKYASMTNILVKPFIDRKLIPIFLKASDVLVLPNSSVEKISNNYTSPLKMFEYMASNVPIVASDLPSIKEVLNDRNCVFAKTDNPDSFKDAINMLLRDSLFSKSISNNAFVAAKKYNWQNRAKIILNLINV